ncbi:MFS transporter [Shewanella sp. C32]|uniref:MFS transporter n=1 Tax=Shewanella electrica TaxID=515560 RepID=A0ABT2FIT3_9GAMM|nr:MFS transporter [Shewanella electrica]MCH1924324.1 MFS transporter [Shewanella electrica]MCS4556226.1 MFS transporter [Shewanella electrica]
MEAVTSIGQFRWRFFIIRAFSGLIMGIIAPVMYLVLQAKGFNMLQIGTLVIVSSISTMVLEVPCGMLSDRLGRKTLFIFGQLSMLLFVLGMYSLNSWGIMLLVMVCAGMSTAMISGTLDALFVEQLKAQQLGSRQLQRGLAHFSLANQMGMLLGALLSGALFADAVLVSSRDSSSNLADYTMNYGLVALLLPLQMLLSGYLLHEATSPSATPVRQGLLPLLQEAWQPLMQQATLRLLLLSSALGATAYISFEKFWQLQLKTLIGEQPLAWLFGALFAGSILLGMAGQAMSPRFCRLFNYNYVAANIAIRLLQAALFAALFWAQHWLSFVLVFALIYWVSALSYSPVMTLFHSEVRDSERSTMLSIRSVFIQLGAVLGVGIAACSAEYGSLRLAFFVSALIYLLSIAVLFAPSLRRLGVRLAEEA